MSGANSMEGGLQQPMISPDELSQRLYHLSPDRFLELYRLYERLGWQTEVGQEMGILRERLTRLRPKRAPTFTRLICQPFESFIGDDPEIAPSHVPRMCCEELSAVVAAQLGPETTEAFREAIRNLPPDDAAKIIPLANRLWSAAAACLEDLPDKVRKELSLPLRASLDLISGCISLGVAMVTLSNGVSREKFKQLDYRGREHLSRIIEALPQSKLPLARYPLIMLSRRMDNPAAILDTLQNPDLVMASSVRMFLVQMMQEHLEQEFTAEAEQVIDRMTESEEGGPPVSIDLLHHAADLAMARKSAGVAAVAARSLLSRISDHVVEKIVTPAPDLLEAHLGPFMDPSHTGADDEEDGIFEAESCLLDLTELSRDAQALAISSDLNRIKSDWSERIKQAIQARIDTMSKVRTDRGDLGEELGTFYGLVRLVEILDGPDRAEALRLDGERAAGLAGQTHETAVAESA